MPSPRPPTSPILLDHFWQFCRRGGQISVALYVVFLGAFLLLQIWPMVAATFAVLSIQVWSMGRIPWKEPLHFQILTWVTVGLFSLLAMRGVGPRAEFHIYLITMLTISFFQVRNRFLAKVLLTAGVIAFFLIFDPWFSRLEPLWPLKPAGLLAVRHMNQIGLCIFIASISYMADKNIRHLNTALLDMATTDPLTGLLNRRRLEEMAGMIQNSHQRHRRPFMVLLGDIDHFKAINDQHTHEGGDLALRAVAECLLGAVRAEDQVARWGGEEFLILLPETSLEAGLEAAERIRRAVAHLDLSFRGESIPVSITLGLSQAGPEDSFTLALGRADQALYRGKAAGRNRVEAG